LFGNVFVLLIIKKKKYKRWKTKTKHGSLTPRGFVKSSNT
jgi:hypothetical protein